MRRCEVRVTGIVQGVGFRPFVYALANELGLTGDVGNDLQGVRVQVQGERVADFLQRLRSEAPPMSVIDTIHVRELPLSDVEGFRIVASSGVRHGAITSIPSDAAVCVDCLREVRDPADRRFGYPFIACTNCGPRYTMTRGLPYDRANTAMAEFPLCPACLAEYTDPTSRRFHAQPVACADCGPRLSMPVADIAAVLRAGGIAAIKGIGGYHLACDARDPGAVARLRHRKQRGGKPFAVMVADIAAAARVARIDSATAGLLQSSARPILLLDPTDAALQEAVAPGGGSIGVMLADTPLHHLLFDAGAPQPLVMTSGNLADEPICIDESEARTRLAGIADVLVHHDRRIVTACDDSVVRPMADGPQLVRRSRGYVPAPIRLPLRCQPMVAVGGEVKATAAVAAGSRAWLTQHVGDVAELQTLQMLQRCIATMRSLQRVEPELVVSDLHPGYLSRRWAQQYAAQLGIPHRMIQHHHAHLASLLADNGMPADEPVLGVVFDGTGYGTDGTIWGGELLHGSYGAVARAGHLRPVQLPGGDAAVGHPARVALAHLAAAGSELHGTAPALAMPPVELRLLQQMLATGSHCTATTSAGRLFDAVASLLDVRHRIEYEAQAAIELEALAAQADADAWRAQVHTVDGQVIIDPGDWLTAAVAAHRDGVDARRAARAFHAGLAEAVAVAVDIIGARTVGLTGGVFGNAVLTHECVARLRRMGVRVLLHRQVPPNDGGLALGQVCAAAAHPAAGVG